MKKYIFITVIFFLSLVACAPEKSEITSTPTPLLSVNVLTYNILYGAGVDRSRDNDLPLAMIGKDRSPLLMEYLLGADADIIGLQEVVGWQNGSPSFMETAASELGMNYFLPNSLLTDMDVAILTKYEIVETESYSDQLSALRAKLITPDGQPLNVFVVHLSNSSYLTSSCETQFLITKMQPYLQQRTIVMGDFNFGVGSPGNNLLTDAGWVWVSIEPHLSRDQFFVSPSMAWATGEWQLPIIDYRAVSDHYPLAQAFDIFSNVGEPPVIPTETPTETKSLPELPPVVTAALETPRVTQYSSFESQCSSVQWRMFSNFSKMADDHFEITGAAGWQSGAMYNAVIPEGKSILLSFLFTPESEFNIFLENGMWADPAYRRFGLYTNGESFLSDMWTGETPLGGDDWNIQPQADTWYNLLLMVDKDAQFTGYLWNPDDPENVAVYHREMEADWGNLPWHMSVGANQGVLQIKDVYVIEKESTP